MEAYYQMMQCLPSEMEARSREFYDYLFQAADIAKVDRTLMRRVIVERSLQYRHYRMEGFSDEEAFRLAAPSEPGGK